MSVRRYLSEVLRDGKVVLQRATQEVELFRMSSNKSMHTSMNHTLVWKYRSIRNPYIKATSAVTSVSKIQDNPILDVPEVQPIAHEYNDEIYLSNRLLAFERDGWKCTQCGSQEKLQAHHIEPVPIGTFNPTAVHRVENLQTLCAGCHAKTKASSQT